MLIGSREALFFQVLEYAGLFRQKQNMTYTAFGFEQKHTDISFWAVICWCAAYQCQQKQGHSWRRFRSLILALHLLIFILDWADSLQDRSGHVLDRICFVLD